MDPLTGMTIICLAVNLPGPAAAARLARLGARVLKVEPAGGDPLEAYSKAWYRELNGGFEVVSLDLKNPAGKSQLDEMLSSADLLLTSYRPSSLLRMGLNWETLHHRFPHLCQVAILGFLTPDDEIPGHDLNYQAWAGLVAPPHVPRTLLADLAGAQEAALTALTLLLARARGQDSGYAEVSLAEAARPFAQPIRYGATLPGGVFNGGLAGYGLYQAKDGWISVSALEARFWQDLCSGLGLDPGRAKEPDLATLFRTHTTAEWESWARERDLPIIAVREAGTET